MTDIKKEESIVKWKVSFNMGVVMIDNEHKAIFAAMKDVEKAILEKDYEGCVSRLTDTLEIIKTHFKNEETLLRKFNYPTVDYDEHVAYHNELLLKARAVMVLCEEKAADKDVGECFRGMIKFLVDDIIVGDLNFKKFLKDKGLISPSS
ncbi:MAG: hypothetical protein COB46_14335 [Rhodospirillaceae bacterium]|nr:MAG: hypothetical protein COB46_14335 [Rhodospirillaceae bacterium]